ncbi:MAG: phosphatase PAP2 family protein [Nitrospinota bacterium]
MDTWLFYAVNHGMENGLFDWLMPIITGYETWILPIIALIAYLVYKNPRQGLFIIAAAVLAVTLSDLINHRVLKEFFARPRPCNVLPDVHLISGCSGSLSFPSSHAVNSFTIAAIFGFYEKKLWIFTAPAAALVAFSRVYVGVHYPADVVVGAMIGIGFGYLAYRAYRLVNNRPTNTAYRNG